jgi:hypothetical protein
MAAMFGGPPPGAPASIPNPNHPDNQPAASFDDALAQAIDDLHSLAGLASDPVEKQDVLKCLAALNQIKATQSKENDQALAGKLSPRHMRKAYGG